MNHPPPPDSCAQCGAPLPRNVRACPECGADERTGWRESSIYDGLDLPDEAFGDDAPARSAPRNGVKWYWVAAAVVLAVLLGIGAFGLR
jgi:hypothetical protein